VGVTGNWQGMKKNKVTLDKEDILVAGGGMMGGGLARQHFKEHRKNTEAAIILCGYLAPRTPGWNLLHGYEPHDCQVEYARLSAHSSASNLEQYIKSCKGKKVIVHTPYPDTPKGLIMPEFQERIILKT
jgi:Cft2 family RNA processing exonuclease